MIYDFLLAICFLFFGAVQTFDLTCLGCCTCTYCASGTAQGTYYVHGLTGITDGTCSTCNVYNTDPMELTQVGSSCVWTGDNTGGCTGGTPTLTINSDGSATFEIGGATYSTAAFDCEGSNTFDLDTSGTDCDDFPATIAISPGSVTDCDECPDGAPTEYQITGTGIDVTVSVSATNCVWSGTGDFGSCNDVTFTLGVSEGATTVTIPVGESTDAQYVLNGTWDCFGENVLTLDPGGAGTCGTWPETVTVTPA